MIILTIRTDKPDAEIGLYDDEKELVYETWYAHRGLAETLHAQIEALLNKRSYVLSDIEGIVCFEGPGSFTGLRIGMTVANALAYSYTLPIVAVADDGNTQWQRVGIMRLLAGESDKVALPQYGSAAIITTPKK